jgi:integrase
MVIVACLALAVAQWNISLYYCTNGQHRCAQASHRGLPGRGSDSSRAGTSDDRRGQCELYVASDDAGQYDVGTYAGESNMASLAKDNRGWRLLFVGQDGRRRTLRLGRVDRRTAESIRYHVENLLVAKTAGVPVRPETAVWLAGVGSKLRERLVRAGLVEAVGGPDVRLADAVASYLSRQNHIKPASLVATRLALQNAVEYFGPGRLLGSITRGGADDFAKWLLCGARSRKHRHATPGLRPTTARKRIERVRAFFRDAVRRRMLPENPFEDVEGPRGSDSDRQVYVSTEIVERLIDATPSLEWKLLLAMARYQGLRFPSEPFSLTWDCVDWERGQLRVPSPKTEVHGKPWRVVPIMPPVRPDLEALFEAPPPGRVYIFHELRQRESTRAAERGWWASVNVCQHLLRLIRRIGERPSPRLWHTL